MIVDLGRMVDRVLAASRVLARQVPCPQGADCAGDQKHNRIFACDHCPFVGCAACLDQHEAAGHESDSSTARELYSGLALRDWLFSWLPIALTWLMVLIVRLTG